ncbi:hypothetical protein DZF91_37765 [Actinomadura logoneensis]|uniref:Uncharacterized protein n=1 Tax=Actinomadura logoneensis TaxID=2293572 RepID=A0A372J9C9_9ACTN|nr:hypothetical protein [Actinomadura logoneensis]RFU36529.1 hypothetical protein DZF91_37765 [Actinomadura logoneensis]
MTYELLLWRSDGPVTRERAEKIDESGAEATPVIAEFVVELRRLHSDVQVVETGGGRFARVEMADDQADQVSTDVYAIARGLGLVVWDPVRGLVHNVAPVGVYQGMQLHTGDGMVVIDPDLGLVRDVLTRLGPENPFAALVVFGHHFVQVSPEDGGYELEYKDGARGEMYRTRLLDLAEVQRAFHEYANDDRGFLDRHTWQTVTTG